MQTLFYFHDSRVCHPSGFRPVSALLHHNELDRGGECFFDWTFRLLHHCVAWILRIRKNVPVAGPQIILVSPRLRDLVNLGDVNLRDDFLPGLQVLTIAAQKDKFALRHSITQSRPWRLLS